MFFQSTQAGQNVFLVKVVCSLVSREEVLQTALSVFVAIILLAMEY